MIPEDYHLENYSYNLPEALIAQHPSTARDGSRLMVVEDSSSKPQHCNFSDIIRFIDKEDLLICNDTKVFPARLFGQKKTGGKVEIFLLSFPQDPDRTGIAKAHGLIKASKRPKPNTLISIDAQLQCSVIDELENGEMSLELIYDPKNSLLDTLQHSGHVPLPPYISRGNSTQEDSIRYQTVYAKQQGAVAAPTAGLHFTQELLNALEQQGTRLKMITLHVGYGTFAPVRKSDITHHQIHKEYFSLSEDTAFAIQQTKKRGGKVWAVGTTTVRTLEYVYKKHNQIEPTNGWCDLYIYPGFTFNVIDNLITNFHLPNSSLMFLVSALIGREKLLHFYNTAVEERYRFFSYGDAMAIIKK